MNAPTATRTPGPDGPPVPPLDRASFIALAGRERPTRAIAVLVGVIAIAFDVAVHHDPASLAAALLVAVAVGGLGASGRMRNRQALVIGAAAVLVGSFLALRTSPWLIPLDVAAALVLTVLAAGFAAGGSITSLSGSALVAQVARVVVAVFVAPAYAIGCVAALVPAGSDRRRRQAVAIGRGIGVALPVVVVLGILLASADAVFASIFSVPDDLGSVVGYLAYGALGVIVASVLFVNATLPENVDRVVSAEPLGATEAAVVLGSMTLLYGLFAGAQVVAITGGAEHVIETAGLTYADYARGGFFQLLAVAFITLVVVCGLRVGTRRESKGQHVAVAMLGEAVVALTLVIVAVAIRRLALYEAEFGSTMLRLASTATAAWLGIVFVLVGLALAGLGRGRRWLLAAVVTSALAALLVWNVVNPEAVVVDRNLARYEQRGTLDTDYLWALSDDAVPAMAAMLPSLDAGTREAVVRRICLVSAPGTVVATRRSGAGPERGSGPIGADRLLVAGPGAPGGPPAPGGLDANRSARTAADVRAEVCA